MFDKCPNCSAPRTQEEDAEIFGEDTRIIAVSRTPFRWCNECGTLEVVKKSGEPNAVYVPRRNG